MSGPITPQEAEKAKANDIPGEVYEAFNELIAKYYHQGSATFKQEEVIKLAAAKLSNNSEYCHMTSGKIVNMIYDNHWADVEDSYRSKGWTVLYDSPAYCESYPATFEFKKKGAKH